jgi:hypothetical protein
MDNDDGAEGTRMPIEFLNGHGRAIEETARKFKTDVSKLIACRNRMQSGRRPINEHFFKMIFFANI